MNNARQSFPITSAVNKRNFTGVEALLSRLEGIRQRSADQWSAICPSHNDKTPSLSIRALPDGRVLIHCFGACTIESVLDAVGMSFQDLYPESRIENAVKTKRKLITAAQALELVAAETTLIAIVAADIGRGKVIDRETVVRCIKAAGRINYIQKEVSA